METRKRRFEFCSHRSLWKNTITLFGEEVKATTFFRALQHVLTYITIVIYIVGDVRTVMDAFNTKNWSFIDLNFQYIFKD